MWWNNYVDTGKRFEVKGRGPDVFDCWGLAKFIYEHDHPAKIILPGFEEVYETTTDYEAISTKMDKEKNNRWQEVDTPQEFDIILIRKKGVPMHVGIVTKQGYMIHCSRGTDVTHEKFDSMRWRNTILGFYRYE